MEQVVVSIHHQTLTNGCSWGKIHHSTFHFFAAVARATFVAATSLDGRRQTTATRAASFATVIAVTAHAGTRFVVVAHARFLVVLNVRVSAALVVAAQAASMATFAFRTTIARTSAGMTEALVAHDDNDGWCWILVSLE